MAMPKNILPCRYTAFLDFLDKDPQFSFMFTLESYYTEPQTTGRFHQIYVFNWSALMKKRFCSLLTETNCSPHSKLYQFRRSTKGVCTHIKIANGKAEGQHFNLANLDQPQCGLKINSSNKLLFH